MLLRGSRPAPSLAEAVSATGGVAVALGVLLVSIDVRADSPGRAAEAAMFAGLVLGGYLALLLLPVGTHPAGVSAIVLGIPGALGWLLLPGAHKFGDIRPFLVLTIAAWLVAFFVPRAGGRVIFIAAAALLLWLWILGEVAGSGAYSASPVPSPPAHTIFSLRSFVGSRAEIDLSNLDANDPLYSFALSCNDGALSACDTLYRLAPAGSDFQEFGATCGNSQPDRSEAGSCGTSSSVTTPFIQVPGSTLNPITPLRGAANDKFLDIGIVSAIFGIVYLAAVLVIDRGGQQGLATAFVVPGFVALLSGTQSLGNAAHHAWLGGLLTLGAGIGIGLVGDRTRRRFTTWAGAVAAAFGAMIVALDTAHISRAFGSSNLKLAGPGMIVIGFGLGLVALAIVLAQLLGWTGPSGLSTSGPSTPGSSPRGFGPPVAGVSAPPVAPAAVWDPTPWQETTSPPPAPTPGPAPPAEPPAGDAPTWPPHE